MGYTDYFEKTNKKLNDINGMLRNIGDFQRQIEIRKSQNDDIDNLIAGVYELLNKTEEVLSKEFSLLRNEYNEKYGEYTNVQNDE